MVGTSPPWDRLLAILNTIKVYGFVMCGSWWLIGSCSGPRSPNLVRSTRRFRLSLGSYLSRLEAFFR